MVGPTEVIPTDEYSEPQVNENTGTGKCVFIINVFYSVFTCTLCHDNEECLSKRGTFEFKHTIV